LLSARKKLDVITAYREVGTYRGAAQMCGVTHKTVKRVIEADMAAAGRVARRRNFESVRVLVATKVEGTRGKIRSTRQSSRARTRSRAASCSRLGTVTGVISPQPQQPGQQQRVFRVGFTRSPAGRCSFDGAATTHRTPAADNARLRPNPVGPASCVTATGPARLPIQPRICSCEGVNRAWVTSPVTVSIAAAATDLACTSSPTLVRSPDNRGLPRMSDRPSRQPLPGNPRDCVSDAPARNPSPTSGHVIPSRAGPT
jgi:hypothetical protein